MATGKVSAGDVFNNWTVVSEAEKDSKRAQQFLCVCVCGHRRVVKKYNLGKVTGCGCVRSAPKPYKARATKPKPVSIRAKEIPIQSPKPQKDLASTIDVPAYQPPRTNRARLESILEKQRLAREIADPWG